MRKPNQIFSVAALAVFVLVHASSLPAAESKSSVKR